MRRHTALLAAVVLLATGCQPAPKDDWNLLILSLDTTRADHLGCYGFAEAMTPNLDRFASESGVLFEHAISPIPLTLPSHTTIMTGTYPVSHGIHDNDGFILDQAVTTLAEMLSEAGFETGAVVASYPLDSQFKLDQGFATYNDDYQQDWTLDEIEARTALSFGFLERTADEVNLAAFRWLEAHRDQRFFLWVHYFDPHQSYDPPPPYDTLLPSRYDGEIAFADENFGALLERLEQFGIRDRTIIVVVGDHGESLGAHGEPTHASYIYDPTIRVPLIISVPGAGLANGARISHQVRTIDIAPTVLELLDVPGHPDIQGQSLVGMMRDPETARHRPALAESHFPQYHYGWGPLRALRTGDWKFILGPKRELYDLNADPQELYNLAEARPEVATQLSAQLAELFDDHTTHPVDRSVAATVDAATRANLEALGYVGGGDASVRALPFPSFEELKEMKDPTDLAIVLNYQNLSTEYLRGERDEEALEMARAGLALDPENLSLHILAARAQFGIGNFDRALEGFKRALEISPSDAGAHFLSGAIYLRIREFDLARESFEAAIQFDPSRIEAYTELGRVYALLGDFDQAVSTLETVIGKDPDNPMLWLRLGSIYTDGDRWTEARDAFQRAMELDPYSPLLLDKIAILYLRAGNIEFARQVLAKAVEIEPNIAGLRLHWAEALLAGDPDFEQAAIQLQYVIDTYPDTVMAQAAQQRLEDLREMAGAS